MFDVFTLIGIFTSAAMVVLIILLLGDWIVNLVAEAKYKHHIKHRFDKPPVASCYCVDCIHYEHDRSSCQYMNGGGQSCFCWRATPKENNEQE